jgi:hypothetical protein
MSVLHVFQSVTQTQICKSTVDLYNIGTTPSTTVLGRDVRTMEIGHACMYRATPDKQASGSVRMDMGPSVVQKRIGLSYNHL